MLVPVWTLVSNHPRHGLIVLRYSPSKKEGETKWSPRPLCLPGNSLCKMSFLLSSRHWGVFLPDFLSPFPHFLSFDLTGDTKLHSLFRRANSTTEWPAGPVVPTAAISRLKRKFLTKNTVAFTEMIFFFFWWLGQLGKKWKKLQNQIVQQKHLTRSRICYVLLQSFDGLAGSPSNLWSLQKGAIFQWRKIPLAHGTLGRCCRGCAVESPSPPSRLPDVRFGFALGWKGMMLSRSSPALKLPGCQLSNEPLEKKKSSPWQPQGGQMRKNAASKGSEFSIKCNGADPAWGGNKATKIEWKSHLKRKLFPFAMISDQAWVWPYFFSLLNYATQKCFCRKLIVASQLSSSPQ